MINKKEIISGTEEEMLDYIMKKYNLIHSCCGGKTCTTQENAENASEPTLIEETPKTNVDPHEHNALPKTAVQVGNKVTTGIKNLFGGTSWG